MICMALFSCTHEIPYYKIIPKSSGVFMLSEGYVCDKIPKFREVNSTALENLLKDKKSYLLAPYGCSLSFTPHQHTCVMRTMGWQFSDINYTQTFLIQYSNPNHYYLNGTLQEFGNEYILENFKMSLKKNKYITIIIIDKSTYVRNNHFPFVFPSEFPVNIRYLFELIKKEISLSDTSVTIYYGRKFNDEYILNIVVEEFNSQLRNGK